MAKKLAFGDAQKRRAPRHSHSHNKLVFSDTAKHSPFSDAAAFTEAQKSCALRYSHSHDESVSSDTVNKSAFSDVAAFSVAHERRHASVYTATKNRLSDTTKKSAFSDVAAFSDAQKTCVPRDPFSHDKSVLNDVAKSQRSVTLQCLVTLGKDVHPGIHTATTSMFSDTAKNAAFSDAAVFSVAQKTCAPRHSHSNDKSVFSDTEKNQRSRTL